MRNFIFYIVIWFSASCVQKKNLSRTSTRIQIKQDTTTAKLNNDTVVHKLYSSCYYIWQVNFEEKLMVANPNIKEETADIDSIIKGLNCMYKNIPLQKIKFINDTLILKITNGEYLTQRMGTSGAAGYLAQTIINLTSVKSVKFVRLDFEEGDHARPGIWSRIDFSDVKIVQKNLAN